MLCYVLSQFKSLLQTWQAKLEEKNTPLDTIEYNMHIQVNTLEMTGPWVRANSQLWESVIHKKVWQVQCSALFLAGSNNKSH